MARDYIAEMQKHINDHPLVGKSSSEVANDIIKDLSKNDPELLSGWLQHNATVFLSSFISMQVRVKRRNIVRNERVKEFLDRSNQFDSTGDYSVFDDLFAIDINHTRKRTGDMTASDHEFVANDRMRRSRKMQQEATFHRLIANKIPPSKTTKDVMTEEEYLKMYESVVSE